MQNEIFTAAPKMDTTVITTTAAAAVAVELTTPCEASRVQLKRINIVVDIDA